MKKNTSKLLTALVLFSAFGSAGVASAAGIAAKTYVDAQTALKSNLQGAGTAGELATVDANGQYVRSGESLSSLQANINSKVDAVELQDYATKTEVSTGLAAKADDAATTAALADKANVSTTYTKTEVDTALTDKADLLDAGTTGEIATVNASGQYIRSGTAVTDLATNANLDLKADKSTTYTKTETDGLLDAKASTTSVTALTAVVDSKADAAATTAALDTKADKSTTYTKTDVDNSLAGKANVGDAYTKSEVDTALTAKADASALDGKANVADVYNKTETYTKTETNDLLGEKASTASVTAVETSVTNLTTTVAGKADAATTIAGYGITDAYTKTQTDAALNLKVDEADLGALAKAAPGACGEAVNKCVLTFDGSAYEWEVIER